MIKIRKTCSRFARSSYRNSVERKTNNEKITKKNFLRIFLFPTTISVIWKCYLRLLSVYLSFLSFILFFVEIFALLNFQHSDGMMMLLPETVRISFTGLCNARCMMTSKKVIARKEEYYYLWSYFCIPTNFSEML